CRWPRRYSHCEGTADGRAADLRQLRHLLDSQVVCATLSVSLPQEFHRLLSSFQVTAHFVV
ncbi:MAG TPA: hypothetical protein VF783_07710, partial [Terriglobales bacterium]